MNCLRRTERIKEYILLTSRLLQPSRTITEKLYEKVLRQLTFKKNNEKAKSKKVITEPINPIKRSEIVLRNFETKALYGPLLITTQQKKSIFAKSEGMSAKMFISKQVVKFKRETTLLFGPLIRPNEKNVSQSLQSSKNLNIEQDKLGLSHGTKFVDYLIEKKTLLHGTLEEQQIKRNMSEQQEYIEVTDHSSNIASQISSSRKNIKRSLNLQLGKSLLSSQVLNNFPLFNSSRSSENREKEPLASIDLPHSIDTSKISSMSGFPSVTTILKNTMPPESSMALERWRQRMIQQLGEEGFLKYNEETLRQGIVLHNSIKELLSGKSKSEITIDPENKGHWHSLSNIFDKISNIEVLESSLQHPYLCYAGAVDCIAKYRDHLCLIDWKTSQKPKPLLTNTFDNPIQLAAYVGAINFDKNYDLQIKNALIVIAYQNGDPAHAHLMTPDHCLKYWHEWLKRLKTFWEKKTAEITEAPLSNYIFAKS